ncbi:MAG: D-alanyl-D-alanine carboxypeptidase [Pseudarthrobacter sp.]|nr:D-alanyl-D-alanine carboxypeptidase [Pseudarthrobacter sp.]
MKAQHLSRTVGAICAGFFLVASALLGPAASAAPTPIQAAYQSTGGTSGPLGSAVGGEKCGLAGGGCYQDFRGGQIHWTPSTGAQATWGAVGALWRSGGWERGPLGYPVSGEVCGLAASGCYQSFQGGQVHWSAASGAQPTLWGAIRNRWAAGGFEAGQLGYPAAPERCGLLLGGCVQQFQGGQIHWAPGIGAFATVGSIDYVWGSLGWENGRLGYPTGDEACRNGACVQQFQGGTLTWRPTSGVSVTYRQSGGIQDVINKRNPLSPLDYAPSDLVNVGGQYLRYPAALAMWQFNDAARAAGINVSIISGYRSYGTQAGLYANYVATYGQAAADTISARPGFSEHQSGLALDIGNPGGSCALQGCFAGTPAGAFAAAHAHEFGFIIRYPAGMDAWTGYTYEPWHLRFVGKDVAGDMRARGTTVLEQYFGYPPAPSY